MLLGCAYLFAASSVADTIVVEPIDTETIVVENIVVETEPTVTELVEEVSELTARVKFLEAQLAKVLELVDIQEADVIIPVAVVAPITIDKQPTPVLHADAPSVKVGGRVKADLIFNSRSVGGSGGTNRADLAFVPKKIPLDGQGQNNQLSASAQDSRIWINALTPTAFGDLGAYIEVDFASSDGSGNEKVSNSYNPRMRHAYGIYGGFTVGQTFTTFLNVSAYPELNEINGPVGILNIRQPLIRYERESQFGRWMIALEQPETVLMTSDGSSIAPDDDRFPDIVGRVDFRNDWGNWSIATMVRQIRIDDSALVHVEDEAWGGAISASGRIYTSGLDNIRFSVSYGKGLGRYLSFNAFDDGVIDDAGNIELTPVFGGYFSYQHWWSSQLRSTVALGYATADIDFSIAPASVNDSYFSSHLNLLWSPIPEVSVGFEWLYGHRSLEDGSEGELHRLQITSLYRF